jgi:hypothetical protein
MSPLTAELVETFTAPKQGPLVGSFVVAFVSLKEKCGVKSTPAPIETALHLKTKTSHTRLPQLLDPRKMSKGRGEGAASVATKVHTPQPLIQSLNQGIPFLSIHRAGDLLRDPAKAVDTPTATSQRGLPSVSRSNV